jgi:cysteine desulfurase
MIYFDNAASTPVFDAVSDYMYNLQKEVFGNPSAMHAFGRKARVEVERARTIIAKMMKVHPSEIFFTSGGTEANNAILWGCAKNLGRKVFITSPIEHPCVLNTLEAIKQQMTVEVHFVEIDKNGCINIEHLEQLLRASKNAVVSIMHANNEIGTMAPMKQISALCKTYGALFHSDIVQTVGKYSINLNDLGVDFAAASAHKFHGPKGVGFMYVNSNSFFKSYISGGMQERNMRAGTENVVGIAGMGMALKLALDDIENTVEFISSVKMELINLVTKELPEIFINGNQFEHSLYSLVNLSLPEKYNKETLLANLDIEGIAISTGSACSSGSGKGSHVLKEIGSSNERSAIRASFSRFNKVEEVHKFVEALKKIGNKE